MDPLILDRPAFSRRVEDVLGHPLRARTVDILQVNLGYRCNMACKHCHVQAGPSRSESMAAATVEQVLRVLKMHTIAALDLTGGAPELHPEFRRLVREARGFGRRVIVRSNLTVAFERGMEDLMDFYAEVGVEVVASLPFYLSENVDRVRGAGTFEKSVQALRRLNELGYGTEGSSLLLNLVFNPQGAYLPPAQPDLEQEFKRALSVRFGITFNRLYTFANMPIGRFHEFLVRSGNQKKYLGKLMDAFNPETLDGVMCRQLISVDWQGRLYDCDFNQVAGLPLGPEYPQRIHDFDMPALAGRTVSVGEHCWGCTAGQGSS